MQQTEKYGFNIIEGGDDFSPVPLNENMEKVEAAIAAKGNCHVVFGYYNGTGEYGQNHPNVLDFADSMGKAPLLLHVNTGGYQQFTMLRGNTLFYPARNLDNTTYCIYFEWTPTGVKWYNETTAERQFNKTYTYYYCALFD